MGIADRICLGTAQLGLTYGVRNMKGKPDRDLAFRILDHAWDRGIRELDTAALYGDSEAVLGSWIRSRRPDGLRVVTKLPLIPDLEGAALEKWMVEACEASLTRLGLDQVEGLLLHRGESICQAGVPEGLIKLMETGLCRNAGLSAYMPEEGDAALRAGLKMVQVPANILDRRFSDGGFLGRAAASDVKVYARSPFLQGLLLMSPQELPSHMGFAVPVLTQWRQALAERGVEPLAAALGFSLRIDGVHRVVLGVEDPEQLDGILEAGEASIPDGWLEKLALELGPQEDRLILPYLWKA